MLVRSHTTLDITGVHFVVHSGATLTLQAPAISVKGLYVSSCAFFFYFFFVAINHIGRDTLLSLTAGQAPLLCISNLTA